MKKTIKEKLISAIICSAVILCMNTAHVNACTTFGIDTQDGKHFQAMGLELYTNLNSKIAKMPRGQEFKAPAPEGMIGAKWTNKYGYIGMNSKDMKWIQGGMNEKGLTVATLYLPGTGYQVPTKADNGKILGAIELPSYILGNFQNIEEVKKGLQEIKVAGMPIEFLGNTVHPFHFSVADDKGNMIVVEYIDGELTMHKNNYKTMANAPALPWHEMNMRNYIKVNTDGVITGEMRGNKLTPIGAGTGTIGLPGDETPVGRFVRTAFYAGSVSPKNAEEGLYETMNILGKMKVIQGSMQYDGANFGEQGDIMNRTQWSWIANQSDKVFYATAYDSPEYFKVDLKAVDFGTKEMETYEFLGKELPVTKVNFK